MTNQGTLSFNGQSIPMTFSLLPSSITSNPNSTQIGNGNLTVNSGYPTSGSYPNTPVYQDSQGYVYVWPNGQFSMKSVNTITVSSKSSNSNIANMPAYGGGGTTTGGTSSGSGSLGSGSSGSSGSTASLPDGTYVMQYFATSPESKQSLNGTQVGIFNTVQVYSQYGVNSGVSGTYDNIPYYENSNGFYYVNLTASNGSTKSFAIATNGFGVNESDALGTISSEASGSTTITVSPVNYSIVLSANPTSVQSGQSVTLTAKISPINSNSIGAICNFISSTNSNMSNPQTIGSSSFDSTGTATIQTSFTNTGSSNMTIYIQAQSEVS